MSAKAEFPPNWQDVVSKAQQVDNVRPADIQGVADQFRQASKDSADHSAALRSSTAVLGGGTWTGPQADAFFAYVKKIGDAGQKVNDHLDEVATELGNLQAFLDRTQKEVQQLRDDAQAKIEGMNKQAQAAADAAQAQVEAANAKQDGATMPAKTPDAIIAENLQATTAVANDANTQIGAKLDASNQEIQRVMGLVQKDVDGGYASVPQLGTKPSSMKSTGGVHGGGSSGGGGGGGGGAGGLGPSGGPPSSPPPGNVRQWIEEAIKILQANGIPVTDADINKIWTIIEKESGGNPNAINLWDCVPLDTAILTQRGWLKHDEVREGDRTIGYNPATGRSEWTRIHRVVHHTDAPLVRVSNTRWHATTTPNHKWVSLPRVHVCATDAPTLCPECGWEPPANGVAVHRRNAHDVVPPKQGNVHGGEPVFVETQHIRSRDRLLLSARAETPGLLDITAQEAAILGWIAGDGHVETRKHRPTISIAQSKPDMVRKLTALLADVPHAVYTDDRGGCGPRHQFRLDHAYARDLLERAGHPRADAVQQVLAMSAEQRDAWLEAIIDAEGTRVTKAGFTRPQVAIYQAPGTVLEAITLAVYLSGRRPRVLHTTRAVQPDSWQPEASVRPNTPVVSAAFLTSEPAGRADVWCVTTELGTWTAREDEHVFLTGNSNAAAGHPSKGLMQCIDSTFNAHKLPGHDDIYNPVDNIIAGVRYTFDRYGGFDGHPGLKSMASGGGYQGY